MRTADKTAVWWTECVPREAGIQDEGERVVVPLHYRRREDVAETTECR